MKTLMLLGAGELGKEFAIAAQRLGLRIIAVDRYQGAPAMQVAHAAEVIDMLDAAQLDAVVKKHAPDVIVPEVEAIRTERLLDFEKRGLTVTPSARAAHLTMNRDAIRDVAAKHLELKTARYAYAASAEELGAVACGIGFPNVVKPVMSSSGKGQSVVKKPRDVVKAWDYAVAGMRGDKPVVIVEEFIPFDFEITLLTVKQRRGPTLFVKPIGHVQKSGDYRESWLPARMRPTALTKAQAMAKKVTDHLGGAGLFGVEFFVRGAEVYFSELSPRPHDTGMVTMITQNLSEFDLHLRAVLGLPIPDITYYGAGASAVILAETSATDFEFTGLERALKVPTSEVRLFGKPECRPGRRMGVALARGADVDEARTRARRAATAVRIDNR